MTDSPPIVILGGSGNLGRALARVWPAGRPALWQHRTGRAAPAADSFVWDILAQDAPRFDTAPGGILALAGSADPARLGDTVPLARAAADLGDRLDCRVLLASSQAVYGPATGPLTEDSSCAPAGAYGLAKLRMEQAVAGRDHVTCLRIGNVAGCDALAAGIAKATPQDPVVLDQFADGQGPRRAMVGAADLAAILPALFDAARLPSVLNVARAGSVAMADVLDALDKPFVWRRARPGALPDLRLDVTLLQAICPVPPGDARAMARQGWPA